MKKRILGICGAISFVIFLILLFVIRFLGGREPSQQMARRWSSEGGVAQVSCFFSVDSGITEDQILEFEHSIDSKLAEASVVQESTNPSARLWVDAYSASGTISISSDHGSIETDAIGIGGDFFLFHPMTLVSGAYFSGNDLMQDYCIIDRDAAWQLFGSSNVAGMTVYIGNVPHIVAGVAERPEGRLAEAAGLDGTIVYVSYKTLEELGRNNGINHYEVIMPDPVTGFVENTVRDSFGKTPQTVEIVENTSRYSLLPRLKLLLQFGTRSMNGKAIIYPYWENIARGYEDILALLTLFEMLFLLFALGVALGLFFHWWRHKGWTLKDKWLWLKDKAERRVERVREKRRRKKEGLPEDDGLPKKEKRKRAKPPKEERRKRVRPPKEERRKRVRPPKEEKRKRVRPPKEEKRKPRPKNQEKEKSPGRLREHPAGGKSRLGKKRETEVRTEEEL